MKFKPIKIQLLSLSLSENEKIEFSWMLMSKYKYVQKQWNRVSHSTHINVNQSKAKATTYSIGEIHIYFAFVYKLHYFKIFFRMKISIEWQMNGNLTKCKCKHCCKKREKRTISLEHCSLIDFLSSIRFDWNLVRLLCVVHLAASHGGAI